MSNKTPAAHWRENGEPDPHAKCTDQERSELPLGNLTDDELANAVFLHGDTVPPLAEVIAGTAKMPIVYLTAAKERIRWLSRKLVGVEQREQELLAEVERVNNQINEMPGMDAFDEIDRLRAECGNWEMALGTVLDTIPVTEIIRAAGTVGDAVSYFKQLHQQRDDLLATLTAITDHFANVMGGPMISGQGVTFANGVDGIPTIKRARELIAKAKGE